MSSSAHMYQQQLITDLPHDTVHENRQHQRSARSTCWSLDRTGPGTDPYHDEPRASLWRPTCVSQTCYQSLPHTAAAAGRDGAADVAAVSSRPWEKTCWRQLDQKKRTQTLTTTVCLKCITFHKQIKMSVTLFFMHNHMKLPAGPLRHDVR